MLVVPDETLWIAEYDSNGLSLGKPHQTDQCSYYIDKFYQAGGKITGFAYVISHLEFVTLTGLRNVIRDLFSEDTISKIFPDKAIIAKFKAR